MVLFLAQTEVKRLKPGQSTPGRKEREQMKRQLEAWEYTVGGCNIYVKMEEVNCCMIVCGSIHLTYLENQEWENKNHIHKWSFEMFLRSILMSGVKLNLCSLDLNTIRTHGIRIQGLNSSWPVRADVLAEETRVKPQMDLCGDAVSTLRSVTFTTLSHHIHTFSDTQMSFCERPFISMLTNRHSQQSASPG